MQLTIFSYTHTQGKKVLHYLLVHIFMQSSYILLGFFCSNNVFWGQKQKIDYLGQHVILQLHIMQVYIIQYNTINKLDNEEHYYLNGYGALDCAHPWLV